MSAVLTRSTLGETRRGDELLDQIDALGLRSVFKKPARLFRSRHAAVKVEPHAPEKLGVRCGGRQRMLSGRRLDQTINSQMQRVLGAETRHHLRERGEKNEAADDR